MKIIVGLGNPGKEYEKTRHNVGWLIIDELMKDSEGQKDKRANCFYSKKKFGKEEVIIVKPLTFMNNSGQMVGYLQKKHRIKTEDIIVIHDDLDIPLGKIRINQNRSSAGHKGVQSIIDHLKTKNFIRIRIGVKPENEVKIPAEKFVLKNFSKKEEKTLKQVMQETCLAVSEILEKGINKAMNGYNSKL